MPLYRDDRMPGGSRYIRLTTWEDEAAGAVVNGAASAAGWLIGSGISGLRTLARNSQDRRIVRAATDLEASSASGDENEFLARARDFVQRYPQFVDGHAELAVALQRKGLFDEAIASVERAVHHGLDETQAHLLRADIYDDANQTSKALHEFTILIRSEDLELRQMSLLSRARLLMQIDDLDQALKDANDAIATLPDEAAYLMRGHVYRRMGNLEACLQDYDRTIKLCPDSADFLQNRAEVYEMLGRMEEAQADRSTAATKEAKFGQVQELLTLLARQGVRLELSANGKAVKFLGVPMRPEHSDVYRSLEGEILKYLREDGLVHEFNESASPRGLNDPGVREFLDLLSRHGVRLELSANGKAVKFLGEVMPAEYVPTYERLKSQILECLQRQ